MQGLDLGSVMSQEPMFKGHLTIASGCLSWVSYSISVLEVGQRAVIINFKLIHFDY